MYVKIKNFHVVYELLKDLHDISAGKCMYIYEGFLLIDIKVRKVNFDLAQYN
jgi:hypothetical protein